MPVGTAERHKVARVDHDGRDNIGHGGRRDSPLGEAEEADWHQDHARERHGGPEENELVPRTLGERVPDGVEHRRQDDQGERPARHGCILTELSVVKGRKSLY